MVPSETPVRILVAASDPLARAGLAALLADQPGCVVTGQVPADASLAAMRDVYAPDVVVLDPGWEWGTASESISDLRETRTPLVVLLPDETHASDAWIAGARGLLLRSTSAEHLGSALIAVGRGLVVLDSSFSAALFAPKDRLTVPPSETLTARELEVLQLIAEGQPNKAIAARLHISEHTVKFHVNAILSKLGAQSRTDAVVRASRLGLILL